ncbi:hypothetical protein FS749_005560 [Ceratobasidium sp. UAMH 11750]|nr:hypothetical protein FS749_005560 [Ceratobasidium sp. UAMH 11750]
MREQILSSLRYPDSYLFINRGYWKPNLSWHVHRMKGGDGSVAEIMHLFPTGLDATSILPMTIIFVDKRTLAFKILAVFRNLLPPALVDQVEVYHALQSDIAKAYAAQRFEQGKVRVLICTEALTMVSATI